ncbi:LacI family transcriptional regulator [Solihabitans fulvus]|uniref:LacI family transcriptional regulator n=1 Tax=Solihabitans fulvus TaxID=1892852 RepID=A0A5B2WTH4_9PSEU|nr:LacI family DNA-binding transcriptional regulator [Solihabitans fulvus]KAA2254134.1 LacI family transcriptional regulator [Solihabitans fulvus]
MGDVARAAGVSAATVSRALRGEPGVSASTRAHVTEVARRMRYAIARDASSLAGGRRYAVAVLTTDVGQRTWGDVLAGAEGALRASGYDVLLYVVGDEAARAGFFEELPLSRRVDGVLVLSVRLREHEAALLRELPVPVVTVGEGAADDSPDLPGSLDLAVRHLVGLGHRDIALVLADSTAAWSSSAEDLDETYQELLGSAGLASRPEWLVWCSPTVVGGEEAVAALFDGQDRPTALIASSGEAALGAFMRLRRDGWAVPEQLSIVSLDGHDIARAVGLTAVEGAAREQGERAVHRLLARIQTQDAAAPELPTPAGAALVERGSTAPPPAV